MGSSENRSMRENPLDNEVPPLSQTSSPDSRRAQRVWVTQQSFSTSESESPRLSATIRTRPSKSGSSWTKLTGRRPQAPPPPAEAFSSFHSGLPFPGVGHGPISHRAAHV